MHPTVSEVPLSEVRDGAVVERVVLRRCKADRAVQHRQQLTGQRPIRWPPDRVLDPRRRLTRTTHRQHTRFTRFLQDPGLLARVLYLPHRGSRSLAPVRADPRFIPPTTVSEDVA